MGSFASAADGEEDEEEDEDEDEDEAEDEDEDESIFTTEKGAGTGPLPSAESLIRGVEELLRKQRENGQQQLNDDEDNA